VIWFKRRFQIRYLYTHIGRVTRCYWITNGKGTTCGSYRVVNTKAMQSLPLLYSVPFPLASLALEHHPTHTRGIVTKGIRLLDIENQYRFTGHKHAGVGEDANIVDRLLSQLGLVCTQKESYLSPERRTWTPIRKAEEALRVTELRRTQNSLTLLT
jgi:hypothetical protein